MKPVSSPKSRWIKFFSIILVYVLVVIADNYTTYLYTPDLTMEVNPLVTLGGWGWKKLIIQDIVGFVIFLFFAYFAFVYYKRTVIQCSGFKEYISMLYFERPDKFAWFFIKAPKKKILYLVSSAYALSIMFIVVRALAVLNNICCIIEYQPCIFCFFNMPHTYHNIICIHASTGMILVPVVVLTIIIPLALFVYYFWFFKEYKINQKALKNLKKRFVNMQSCFQIKYPLTSYTERKEKIWNSII